MIHAHTVNEKYMVSCVVSLIFAKVYTTFYGHK